MKKTDIIKFPCSFPVKVMGLNTDAFQSAVAEVFQKHVREDISYSKRMSSGDKYLSITATFIAQSKRQLDELYQELNSHKLVLMTL